MSHSPRKKRIPPTLNSWEKIARIANRQCARMIFRQGRRSETDSSPMKRSFSDISELEKNREGFDLRLLTIVFQVQPTISKMESDEQRNSVLCNLQNLLGITLRRTFVELPDRHYLHSYYGHPNDFDRWVMERVATFVGDFGPIEESAKLWKPILNLDLKAADWIECYLHDWFLHGSKAAVSIEAFSSLWQSQIAYALAAPCWGDQPGSGRHSYVDLYTGLMGLHWSTYRIIGNVEFRATIASMRGIYRRWAFRCLSDDDSMMVFARFLQCESAVDLLDDGLSWILEAIKRYDERDWDDAARKKDDLVDLVEHWWSTRGRNSLQGKTERTTALGLLKVLADQQHARALEIQDRVARTM